MDSYRSSSAKPIYKGAQIVWLFLGILEAILAFRFALRLFGANPAAGFTKLIYDLSYPLVAPFINVFSATRYEGSVFEWTTLLAMFVYWLIALGIIKLFFVGRPISTRDADDKLDRMEGR